MALKIESLPCELTVCTLADTSCLPLKGELYFIGKTDEEVSLVCPTGDAPRETLARKDGWRAFRISGVLDFSLIGILSGISTLLAEGKIGIFAVSTFNTDYILVKKENFGRALDILSRNGYEIL
ncbi:MAG: ACT domain-containing protein [Oscillospiraceae bacterium]|jgi:hypothetical protein|nr:ACT domain-containing protein [Oscillospiraceae bacterium]